MERKNERIRKKKKKEKKRVSLSRWKKLLLFLRKLLFQVSAGIFSSSLSISTSFSFFEHSSRLSRSHFIGKWEFSFVAPHFYVPFCESFSFEFDPFFLILLEVLPIFLQLSIENGK